MSSSGEAGDGGIVTSSGKAGVRWPSSSSSRYRVRLAKNIVVTRYRTRLEPEPSLGGGQTLSLPLVQTGLVMTSYHWVSLTWPGEVGVEKREKEAYAGTLAPRCVAEA